MPQETSRPHDPPGVRPTWAESGRFVPSRFVQPVLSFMRTEASGGILMLLAAIAALALANSPLSGAYEQLVHTELAVELGQHLHFEHTLQDWINDGLMAIFFFVVGLEIKRELVVGELKERRAAALPAFAALGGMVLPALIYLAFNGGTDASQGWGIPMATDIAFAVGVISLVGRRVPLGAKLFLLAVAIVDDVGAILVIALFYTQELAVGWLATAFVLLFLVYGMRRIGIRSQTLYVLVAVLVWVSFLESGVHATIAGVALALLTPTTPLHRPEEYASIAVPLVGRVADYAEGPRHAADDHRTTERIQALLRDVTRLSEETVSPLDRLENRLAPWSSFVIVPLFAFANAGVSFSTEAVGSGVGNPVLMGVTVGLVVGKVVGVVGGAWLAVKAGIGTLPRLTSWRHVTGVGLLAGIGFTVALFVTALAFPRGPVADSAKMGIFLASLVSGIAGFVWLRLSPPVVDRVDIRSEVAVPGHPEG